MITGDIKNNIEQQKQQVNDAIKDLETLLASRMQYWFDFTPD